MCYGRHIYYPLHVIKVIPYRWNSKCLEAPKLHMYNGYYTWPQFVVRRVVPGLVSVPEPIKPLTPETLAAINNSFKETIRYAKAIGDHFLRSLRVQSDEDVGVLGSVAHCRGRTLEKDILQTNDVMGTEIRTVYAFGGGGSVSVTYPVLRRPYEPVFPLVS